MVGHLNSPNVNKIHLFIFCSSYLLDFILDGQYDTAEAGSVVGAWRTLINVTIQYGLYFLCVPTKVQHTHHKVLTLHGQRTVVILQRGEQHGGEKTSLSLKRI